MNLLAGVSPKKLDPEPGPNKKLKPIQQAEADKEGTAHRRRGENIASKVRQREKTSARICCDPKTRLQRKSRVAKVPPIGADRHKAKHSATLLMLTPDECHGVFPSHRDEPHSTGTPPSYGSRGLFIRGSQ